MSHLEPGILIIASSEFEAYKHPDQIPAHEVERNDPQNSPIIINVGTWMMVLSGDSHTILLWLPGEEACAYALKDDVERNTVVDAAVDDLDWAYLMEYRILHGRDPITIWAARTAWAQLDEGFDE